MRCFFRVSIEAGGNAPFIVFDDADIDQAVEGGIPDSDREVVGLILDERCNSLQIPRKRANMCLRESYLRPI